ncbi:hypothetical protein TNCT_251811 [Trichonephila clavata]|uniref:Uncharacterized protein n=1 Tax=Trichonephila clavata TaxID=2740835 RepID=A0A8X6F5L3_TRICU|nr:hypothetical protein TNCT_251811 [Trichonephila clavata]
MSVPSGRYSIIRSAFWCVLRKVLLVGIANISSFYRLDYSFVAMTRSFRQKYNDKKGPANSIVKALIETLQRIENINDNHAGNVSRPIIAVTETMLQSFSYPKFNDHDIALD